MSILAHREVMTADENRMIHFTLPADLPDQVEVIVIPASSAESMLSAQAFDESGFAKTVLQSEVEECWNAL